MSSGITFLDCTSTLYPVDAVSMYRCIDSVEQKANDDDEGVRMSVL